MKKIGQVRKVMDISSEDIEDVLEYNFLFLWSM